MDIDFKKDGYRFLVRCSAIITNKEKTKLILFRVAERDFWMLPGGRVNYAESSKDAIKREMLEELGINSEYNLICIEENFLLDKKIQNIEFIYHTEINNIDDIKALEDKGQEFKVVELKNLNDYILKPNSLKSIIKEYDINNICHKINYE